MDSIRAIADVRREDVAFTGGYDDFFAAGREAAGFGSYAVARVTAEYRGSYRVMNGTGERIARITGKQMFEATSREDYPTVGDWVAITELDAEQAVIHGMLPRRTVLKRRESGGEGVQVIAANVDVVFVVQAVGRDFNINRFERYATVVAAGGARPSCILNKSDLLSDEEIATLVAQITKRLPDTAVITASTVAEHGLDELTKHLERGKTYCFVGSSGVGKSSIVNTLLGRQVLATKEISARAKRGQHVTTTRALFVLDSGAMVIDNPGMREFGILDAESGIGDIFESIVELAATCRFPDCSHTAEVGCAVRAAIEAGTLDAQQFESYEKLKKENEFHEMTQVERRHKDRAFGKFIKKAKEEIEKYS